MLSLKHWSREDPLCIWGRALHLLVYMGLSLTVKWCPFLVSFLMLRRDCTAGRSWSSPSASPPVLLCSPLGKQGSVLGDLRCKVMAVLGTAALLVEPRGLGMYIFWPLPWLGELEEGRILPCLPGWHWKHGGSLALASWALGIKCMCHRTWLINCIISQLFYSSVFSLNAGLCTYYATTSTKVHPQPSYGFYKI